MTYLSEVREIRRNFKSHPCSHKKVKKWRVCVYQLTNVTSAFIRITPYNHYCILRAEPAAYISGHRQSGPATQPRVFISIYDMCTVYHYGYLRCARNGHKCRFEREKQCSAGNCPPIEVVHQWRWKMGRCTDHGGKENDRENRGIEVWEWKGDKPNPWYSKNCIVMWVGAWIWEKIL